MKSSKGWGRKRLKKKNALTPLFPLFMGVLKSWVRKCVGREGRGVQEIGLQSEAGFEGMGSKEERGMFVVSCLSVLLFVCCVFSCCCLFSVMLFSVICVWVFSLCLCFVICCHAFFVSLCAWVGRVSLDQVCVCPWAGNTWAGAWAGCACLPKIPLLFWPSPDASSPGPPLPYHPGPNPALDHQHFCLDPLLSLSHSYVQSASTQNWPKSNWPSTWRLRPGQSPTGRSGGGHNQESLQNESQS